VRRKLLRDARGGEDILAAGEAVREQRIGCRRLVGRIEARGQLLSGGPRERDALDFQ